MKEFGKLLVSITDQFLPSLCSTCKQEVYTRHIALCDHCYFSLPWIHHACATCSLPLSDQTSNYCGQCLLDPPGFFESKIPFCYEFPIDEMILNFKFNQHFVKGKCLSALLIDHLYDAYDNQILPDALIPVPMYKWRLFKRGFNQSELIALEIAKAFNIPILKNICLRQKPQRSQKESNQVERISNLKNTFIVNRNFPSHISGKRLALIDDVVTTGSTVRELSRILLDHGAISVSIWALARTPFPQTR